MAPRSSVTWIFALLLAYVLITDAKQRKCPNACECYFSKTNWVTDCSWLEPKVIHIPFDNIDPDVHTLNMTGNEQHEIIYTFPAKIQPRILDVSYNVIRNITTRSFAGLRHLEYIDISHNYGPAIHPNSFQ